MTTSFNTFALICAFAPVLVHGCVFMDQSVLDSQANESLEKILWPNHNRVCSAARIKTYRESNAESDGLGNTEICNLLYGQVRREAFLAYVASGSVKPLTVGSIAEFLKSMRFDCFETHSPDHHLKCVVIHRDYAPNLLGGRSAGDFYYWELNAKNAQDEEIKMSANIIRLGEPR